MTTSYLDIFTQSHARVVDSRRDDKDFFAAFYDAFTARSAAAAEKFSGVDMAAQRAHLKNSLDQMVYFSIDRQAGARMEQIAATHSRSGRNISPELYTSWLDALVDTVREYDEDFDAEVEAAWRIVLAPGISYMQLMYSRA